jgi:threonyl-tRNA synthetase
MTDHRLIAKDLELYLADKSGQGLLLLLPNWVIVRNQLQQLIRQKWVKYDFQEVITPILGSQKLYQISGHLAHYRNDMFPEMSRNNENYYLRPMTCPHHCLIYQQKPRSYRDLPLRLCENSILHRYEASGALKGLERTRWFELADHHIFVNNENLKEELKKNYYFIKDILNDLDFTVERLICSLHDPHNREKYHDNEELWQKSENLLITVLEELKKKTKLEYLIQKGEAAFYGPKLDLEVKTADGKYITISTIQLDFLLPQRFNLQYIDKEQKIQKPIVIHQSPIGSYQRFIALLLEKNNGKLPFWLAPIQLVILPLNEEKETQNYCQKLLKELSKNSLRAKIFSPKKTLNYRIKQVHEKKIPCYITVGRKEVKNKKLKLSFTYSSDKEKRILKKLILGIKNF